MYQPARRPGGDMMYGAPDNFSPSSDSDEGRNWRLKKYEYCFVGYASIKSSWIEQPEWWRFLILDPLFNDDIQLDGELQMPCWEAGLVSVWYFG